MIAIANQKGGVGKSTTAVSLGAALAEAGKSVLVVDLDPQGNASTGLGIRHDARDVTIYEVLVSEAPMDQAVVPTAVERLFAVPSTIDLAGAEIELVSVFSREMRLAKAMLPVVGGRFEYILLDCPPSLGLLTVNALAAAEELIVPIQCEYYALEGLSQLLRNVSLIQQNVNTRLQLTGIVMTMFDSRTRLSEQVVEEVRKFFGKKVYDTVIPRTVRLSEAPGYGEPITVYDSRSKGAECYRSLAQELLTRPKPKGEKVIVSDLPEVIAPAPPPRERPSESEHQPEVETNDEGAIPSTPPTSPSPAPAAAQPQVEVHADPGVPDPGPADPEGSGTTELAHPEAQEPQVGGSAADPSAADDAQPALETDPGGKRKWRLFRKGGDW